MQRIREDVRANYAYAAFVGWQLGAGSGKNFSQYLSSLELGGTKKIVAKDKQVLKSEALEYAAKIIARDKKRKKNV